MREQQNRFKVKKLFILGAGATYSITKQSPSKKFSQAPLDCEFCKRLLQLTSHQCLYFRLFYNYQITICAVFTILVQKKDLIWLYMNY